MGASFESHRFSAKTEAEAIKHAKTYQQQRQHEDGHGPYTGHLGTAGVGVQRRNGSQPYLFATVEEAEDWVLEHHNKWDLPYLVKIGKDGDQWMLAGLCSR